MAQEKENKETSSQTPAQKGTQNQDPSIEDFEERTEVASKTNSSTSQAENSIKTAIKNDSQGNTSSDSNEPSKDEQNNTSGKRKDHPEEVYEDDKTSSAPPKKQIKTSATSSSSPQIDTLEFLLSEKVKPLYIHADSQPPTDPQDGKSYFSAPDELNPWEHLMTALVISRPLSHVLGQRTVGVLLNPPYSFNGPEAVIDAGEKKVYEAFEASRTQHRQKTAADISAAATLVNEKQWFQEGKNGLRGKAFHVVRNALKEIKGVGDVGCDVFLRRVQGNKEWWDRRNPFVDSKSANALQKLGLPSNGKELLALIEAHCDDLGFKGEKEDCLRKAFVDVVERALGVVLEGNEQKVMD